MSKKYFFIFEPSNRKGSATLYCFRYYYINIIFFCCHWLAMSNSCLNPIIYGVYNVNIALQFSTLFLSRLLNCQFS